MTSTRRPVPRRRSAALAEPEAAAVDAMVAGADDLSAGGAGPPMQDTRTVTIRKWRGSSEEQS